MTTDSELDLIIDVRKLISLMFGMEIITKDKMPCEIKEISAYYEDGGELS